MGARAPQIASGGFRMAGKLLKRIAKTTGTTRGEAKGIMKNVRQDVRAGNKKAARKELTQALKGGPSAGVKKSPARTEKARATSKKVVGRIADRQASVALGKPRTKGTTTVPGRRPKPVKRGY